MGRKNSYKMVVVIDTIKAPGQFSGRLYEYEKYSCGHYSVKPEIRETAKMIRAVFNQMSGTPQKRRCSQCVSGKPSVPEISHEFLGQL